MHSNRFQFQIWPVLTIVTLFNLGVLCGCQESDKIDKISNGDNQEQNSDAKTDKTAAIRDFKFSYGFTILDLPQDSNVKIWIPVPSDNAQQTVRNSTSELKSSTAKFQPKKKTDSLGNAYLFYELKNLKEVIEFSAEYEIRRKEASAYVANLGIEKKTYLAGTKKTPLKGKPLELLEGIELDPNPLEAARQLYDIVELHMAYDKSKPGYGTGDAVWACDSKTGNCTDFHSLFISLARSQSIPARFEIGFPLPPEKTKGKIGGYHCWAWFYDEPNSTWSPVDISEADKHPELKEYYFGNLTQDRVSFSTGRNISLDPKPTAGDLNYFVYPHIEVDGKPWAKDKIELDFQFENLSRNEDTKK